MFIKAIILAIVLASTGISAQFVRSPGATLRICYCYFGSIDDLGYTFSYNLGRLTAQNQLQQEFPDIKIESLYEESVFFMPREQQRQTVLNYVQRGCHVILGNGEGMFGNGYDSDDEMPKQFPNVSWVVYNQFRTRDTSLPNRVFAYLDMSGAWYLAGVAAAREAKRCIGLISAHEGERNSNDATNGFIKGIRSVNATLPLHVVSMNSWYWPPAERRAAKLLLQRDCDMVAHYSDPRDVDIVVSQATGARSIGPHSNLQLYVGDTVLLATYSDWARIIVPIVRDVVNTGRVTHNGAPHLYGFKNKGMVTTPLSPTAALDTVLAFEATKPLVDEATLFCGTTKLRNGASIVGSGPGGCMTAEQRETMKSYIDDPATHFHPDFQFEENCAPGTTFSYTATGNITLSCTPCPVNTFSDTKGAAECKPCPDGTVAEPGSSNCTVEVLASTESSSLSTAGVVGIVVSATLVVLVLVGAISSMRLAAARKNKNAPRKGPLCLLFTDVESSTKLWQEDPKGMEKAIEIHHKTIRSVIEKSGAYEVKTVGDSFMIAVSELVDGVQVALDIQTALQEASWPEGFQRESNYTDRSPAINGLKVRIGLQWCTDVTVKFEAFHNYYDYYGNDVNLAARVESQARGGQILVVHETVEALEANEDFALVKDELSMSLFARNVELRGVDGTRTLFTFLPVGLKDRQFEPLEGHEKDAELSAGAQDCVESMASETASMISNNSLNTHTSTGAPTDVLIRLIDGCSSKDQAIVLRCFAESAGVPLREGGTVHRKIRQLVHHLDKEKEKAAKGNEKRDDPLSGGD